jgi:hypothetical protein
MDYHQVTLDTLNMGAVRDLFEAAWERLLENIGDENTKAEAVRSIAITVKVKPNKNRDNAATVVAVTEKLAPLNPHEHFVVLSTDGRHVQAFTANLNQPSLGLEEHEPNVTPFAAGAAGR